MQAIILAAGMGRRLGELTRYDTKCMIEVNGIRIIDRLLANLAVARLSRIVLVIGFQGDKLRAYLGNEYCGIPIYYLENPYYAHTNNIYSLFLARHHLASDDTLLLESDIVFEKRILERVLEEPYPDVAVVDRYKSWMDGTMVTVDEKQFIVDFVSKHTFSYEKTSTYFKTVNIYRFSKEFSVGKYVPFLEAYCKCFDNSAYYEQILAVLSLLDKAGLKALPLEGEKWYEIDDMQDLDIAETLFGKKEGLLPGYQKRYGGYWRFPFLFDFAYLVNPHFPTERMLEELKANFDKLLRQYPSGSYVNRRLVAKHWNIPAEAVAVGNGAAELIRKLMELLPGRMGVILPTFEEYLVRDDRIETFLPLGPGYRYTVSDLKTFFEDKGVTSLLLLNPDNPSGNSIPYKDLISFALFIITIPSLIEGICVRDNFLKSDDFGVRCIFKGKVGLLTVFLGALLCGKSPVSGSDAMPVFRCYPPSAFVLMPALCPLPKTIVNLIVDFAECFSGYNKSLVVDPSTDNRVELANQGILLCRFVTLDDFAHLF